jgi:peptidoglycan hydrolase CwlO-like protein
MRINRDEALNDRDEALDGRDELHRALQSVTQQIVHMNGQIGALNDKVGALQAENTTLKDKIGALEKENTAIGAQTKKLHKELLQERLDRIETDRKLQKEVQERRLLELEVVKLSASVREIGNKLERFQKASDLVTEAFELKEATRHRKLRSLFAAHQSIDTMQKWTLRGNRSVGPLPSQYERFCQDGPLFSA